MTTMTPTTTPKTTKDRDAGPRLPVGRWLLGTLSLWCPLAAAQPAALRVPGPLSPRNASYDLSARLDEKAHRVTGHEVLFWRNLENQPAGRLVFHLYQNAFKNRASTFIRETGPQLRGDPMPEGGYGAIDVTALKVGGQDLLSQATVDDTLMTVPLPKAVGPSAAVQVEIDFVTSLPKSFARSGYAGEFNAVTQWFPKIGVFDCAAAACRWRADPYHGNSEFFADYGVYDVRLDVPAGYVVGATGVRIGDEVKGDRRVLRYHAEDVHDFAWLADPRFVEVNDRIDDAWGSVSLRLLTRRGLTGMNAHHLRATREGLLELERRFGVYPYSNVTVVVPPDDAMGSGGMEYPTLFTSEPVSLPGGAHVIAVVDTHELGHQYFYGIVGSDEVNEAFLDEGLNETFTTWAMERMFGPRCDTIDLLGFCLSSIDEEWLGYRSALRREPIATPAYQFFPPDTYAAVTYAQTAVTMRTLERYLGSAKMEAGMRRYVDRYRFHHPSRADFTAAFNEGAGVDLRWFWEQALTSTKVADYKVLSATTIEHQPAGGLWDCPPGPIVAQDPEVRALIKEGQEAACAGQPAGRREFDPDADRPNGAKAAGKPAGTSGKPDAPGKDSEKTAKDSEKTAKDSEKTDHEGAKLHDSEVYVQRLGDFVFPVTIRMTFADGATVNEQWSYQEQKDAGEVRVRRYQYPRRSAALAKVEIDPAQTLILDERRLNNGLLVKSDGAPARRLASTFHGLAQTLLDLLGP